MTALDTRPPPTTKPLIPEAAAWTVVAGLVAFVVLATVASGLWWPVLVGVVTVGIIHGRSSR